MAATLPALTDVPQNCTGISRLPNGIQIFPGSVPIYRGNTLVGGIGVSGDGVDQDDMVASSACTTPASRSAARSATRRVDARRSAGAARCAPALRAMSAGAVPRHQRRQRLRGQVICAPISALALPARYRSACRDCCIVHKCADRTRSRPQRRCRTVLRPARRRAGADLRSERIADPAPPSRPSVRAACRNSRSRIRTASPPAPIDQVGCVPAGAGSLAHHGNARLQVSAGTIRTTRTSRRATSRSTARIISSA